VAELARIREEEGYMAEWNPEQDGSLFLIENHCPICAAADELRALPARAGIGRMPIQLIAWKAMPRRLQT
jgi:hypothetical protein